MSKAIIHAHSSAAKFGGKPEDYLPIHDFLDSSKSILSDNRHRALTHNSWFLNHVLERVFGVTITNANGQAISVKEIGEQHVLEDFGGKFIPSAQDYLQEIEYKQWMNGDGYPESRVKIEVRRGKIIIPFIKD